jgi:hypothetical protein
MPAATDYYWLHLTPAIGNQPAQADEILTLRFDLSLDTTIFQK